VINSLEDIPNQS